MKQFFKWRTRFAFPCVVLVAAIIYALIKKDWIFAGLSVLTLILYATVFFGFWLSVRNHGIQTELDISRVLGKDAKDALSFGNIGILTYDDDYVVTWASEMFAEQGIDIVGQKLASWIENIRTLFDDEVDVVVGKYKDHIYEITRKQDAQLLYVKDITDYYELRQDYVNNEIVVGLMQLDNYMEYQAYENEEIIANINTHLRTPLVTWAKENGMFIRRLRSDRFLVILNQEILKTVRAQNFTILQEIKDEAQALDVSITLSMAFAYGTSQFPVLDDMVNELIELAQSRGGDQAAIRAAGGTVQFIGGNSELNSNRSKVRVRIMAQSIQEAISDCGRVFIAGHVNSDFDCMGSALSMSNWATALHKDAYIVLDGVPRDAQLQNIMDFYNHILKERHVFITPEMAAMQMDFEKDLLIMVDHGLPMISSAKDFVANCSKVLVIDHHRKNENFVRNTMLTYVESTASSACELIVELLQNMPNHVPIYEVEATIMYLGILVDTNRFKMHTDARTFEAAAALRSWGANSKLAEKALQEDYSRIIMRNKIINKAKSYYGNYMVACVEDVVDKTMLSQVSDSLLLVKGCQASFTIAYTSTNPQVVSVSARSDGTINVQKIIEQMQGGGHFTAAAVDRRNVNVKQVENELLRIIKEEYDEGNIA